MKDSIYIICDKNGVKGYRKNKPPLNSGEVAIRVDIVVPTAYFERFVPTVNLTIPEPPPLAGVSVEYDGIVEADPLDILFEEEIDNET